MFEFESVPLREFVRLSKGSRAVFMLPTKTKSSTKAVQRVHAYAQRVGASVTVATKTIVDLQNGIPQLIVDATIVKAGKLK